MRLKTYCSCGGEWPPHGGRRVVLDPRGRTVPFWRSGVLSEAPHFGSFRPEASRARPDRPSV